MTARGVFIAGTDTGIGKTRLTTGWLRALRAAGWQAVGMKPVATGAERHGVDLINEDVVQICAESGVYGSDRVHRADINPYCFEPPISPHIAAEKAGICIDMEPIMMSYGRLAALSDAVLVEGTGGWLAPIGPSTTMADIAVALKLPVVLVVGVRLGCLSHALLSVEAIARAGSSLLGWVANLLDTSMPALDGNLTTLERRVPAPRLALLAGVPDATRDAAALAIATHALMRGHTMESAARR